jgi:hypothetical protein
MFAIASGLPVGRTPRALVRFEQQRCALVNVLADELLQWLCLSSIPALENTLGMSRRRAGFEVFVSLRSPLQARHVTVGLLSSRKWN